MTVDLPVGLRERLGLSQFAIFRAAFSASIRPVSSANTSHYCRVCPICREPFVIVGSSSPTPSVTIAQSSQRERFDFDACYELCRRPRAHLGPAASDARVVLAVAGVTPLPIESQPVQLVSPTEILASPYSPLVINPLRSSVVLRAFQFTPQLLSAGQATLLAAKEHFLASVRLIPGFMDYAFRLEPTGLLMTATLFDSPARAEASTALARRYRRNEPGFANLWHVDFNQLLSVLIETTPLLP